jgi:hypothetical protein
MFLRRKPSKLLSAENNFKRGNMMKIFRLPTLIMILLCFCAAGHASVNIECNRQCLAGFMTTYLNALVAHDASKLPVAKNVKYTENGKPQSGSKLPKASHRKSYDALAVSTAPGKGFTVMADENYCDFVYRVKK